MIKVLDLITLLLGWSYGFLFLLILHSFIPLRRNRLLWIPAYVICSLFANMVIYSNDLPNLLGALLLLAAYILLFHSGRWIEKLTAVLVFYPVVVAVNYLMQDMGSRLFFACNHVSGNPSQWPPGLLLISTAIHTCSLLVRLLFWLGAWALLRKYLGRITSDLTLRMWLIVDVLTLASIVAIFTIIYFLPEEAAVVYPICATSIVSSFGCIYLAAYICSSVQTACHAQELEQKQAYFQDKLRDEKRIRSIYHDMKNHLLVLQTQQANSEVLNESARSLQEQIETYETYYHTGNDYLDMILRDKSRLAREKQIDFHAAVSFSEGAFLKPLDISTIFGNALDNAVEASEKLPESMRLITVKAAAVHDMLVIAVENNRSLDEFTPQKTSKKDSFLHGFGISNIQKAVEKYGGECIARPKEEKFIVKIILPIAESESACAVG